MKNLKTNRTGNPVLLVLMVVAFLFVAPSSAYSDDTESLVRLKPEYKIKRVPSVGVTLYTSNEEAEKEEYIFKDFNADVVLLIYRRINVDQISSSLAKKYYLSEDDSRRGVKRVINVLEQWGMVSE